MRGIAKNTFNERTYRAEASLVATADQGGQRYWIRIIEPGAWGRARSGIGPGHVIDQGWREDLVKRGWEIAEVPQQPSARSSELQRLAGLLRKEDRAAAVADRLLV